MRNSVEQIYHTSADAETGREAMAEDVIGGFISGHLARGVVRGYGLYVTSDRIIGVKGGLKQVIGGTWGDALGGATPLARDDTLKALEWIERKKDFEVRRDELERVTIRRHKVRSFFGIMWGGIEIRASKRTYKIRIGKDMGEVAKLRKMFAAFEPDKFVFGAD